jgi:hydroxyethylthiazole kinase
MKNNLNINEAIKKIRKNRPLIHHITNYVVANATANYTLAIGASPIMASSKDEVAEIAGLAEVLVLNIGTITTEQFEGMKIAACVMKERDKKVVLDPVGVGVSKLRYSIVEYFIKEQLVDVVKGNYSEIIVLSGLPHKTKGVDSLERNIDTVSEAIEQLSNKYKCIFAATGETDIICNGINIQKLSGGNKIMQYFTGSGCIATSSVGAFLSVASPYDAAIYGLNLLKITASKINATGPAEFYNKLIDSVYSIN